jgi:hypothetical protein
VANADRSIHRRIPPIDQVKALKCNALRVLGGFGPTLLERYLVDPSSRRDGFGEGRRVLFNAQFGQLPANLDNR